MDDAAAVVAAWKSLYQKTPESWHAAAYWSDFVIATDTVGDNTALAEAAHSLLAHKNTPPFLRASARDALAQVAFDAGKTAEAVKSWAELGYVRNWQVIGPFDNTSRSGFDTAFAPEKKIAFKDTTPGSNGQTLKWFPMTLAEPDGTVAIGRSLGQSSPGVYYAVTSITSPADREARLAFNPNGAAAIFINGVPVLRDTVYRTAVPLLSDPISVRILLKKGTNTILVKVAGDTDQSVHFRLRLTDSTGETTLHLPANPLAAQTEVPVQTTSAPASIVPEPIAVLHRRLAEAPNDVEAQLRLGVSLRDGGEYEAAIAACRQAVALAPQSGIVQWELSRALEANSETDAAREARERARRSDPRIVGAQIAYLDEQDDAIKPNDRVKLLKSLLIGNPKSSELLWALAMAQSAARTESDSLRTARRAAATVPGSNSQSYLYHWLVESRKQAEADTVLNNALLRFPNTPELLAARAQQQIEKGNAQGTILAFQKFLSGNAPTAGVYYQFADAYVAARMLPKAVALLSRARSDFPQSALICTQLGDIQRDLGNKNAALVAYREAIRLDPAQIALREKVQVLSGEQPVAKLVSLTNTAPLLAKLPRSADNPGVSEVRVLDEGYVIVYPDYAQAHFSHEIITCLDSAAVQKYQQYPVSSGTASGSSTVETARIIKPNGKIVDCKDKSEEGYAAFPSLAPGDTIDLTYRTDDFPSGGLGGKFWTSWMFTSPNSPMSRSHFVLVTPKEMPLTLNGHGGLPDPSVKEIGKWRIREWNVTSKGDAKPEILAIPERDSGMWLDASSFENWQGVVRWYQSLSTPRCIPDAVVRAKTDELTKDSKTEDEKIRAVVRFVADKIPYQSSPFRLSAFVPTEGKSVIGDSFGDCKDKAALVVAMLQHLGIRSHMVLLSGRSHGITPYLPGPRFDHAIAVVDTQNGPLWVDATADSMEYGNLPFDDQGVPALVIADSTTDLTTTPVLPVEKSQIVDATTATLEETGALTGSQSMTATGGMGWLLRMAFRRVPESSQDQALTGLFAAILPDARPSKTRILGLNAVDSPLELSADFTVPDFAQATDRLIIARVPWSVSSLGNRVGATKALRKDAELRRTDLEVAVTRIQQISRITMTLPTGWKVKDMTPEVKGDSPFGSYRFTYTMNGNTLTAERTVSYTPLRILAKDVVDFLKFDDALEKQAKAPLVLEKL